MTAVSARDGRPLLGREAVRELSWTQGKIRESSVLN
jgi:hypothetical protein